MFVYVNNFYIKYNDSIYNWKFKFNLYLNFYFNNENSLNYYFGNCVYVLFYVLLGLYLIYDKLY